MDFQLLLHDTPPSLNQFGSVGGGTHHRYRRLKKQWQDQLSTALMAAGVPRSLVFVAAAASLTFPTRRRRDEGNFRFLLEKALGDALVEGGWLEDDTSDHFAFERVFFSRQCGAPLTVLSVVALDTGALDAYCDTGLATWGALHAAADISQRQSEDKKLAEPAGKSRWRHGVKG